MSNVKTQKLIKRVAKFFQTDIINSVLSQKGAQGMGINWIEQAEALAKQEREQYDTIRTALLTFAGNSNYTGRELIAHVAYCTSVDESRVQEIYWSLLHWNELKLEGVQIKTA